MAGKYGIGEYFWVREAVYLRCLWETGPMDILEWDCPINKGLN